MNRTEATPHLPHGRRASVWPSPTQERVSSLTPPEARAHIQLTLIVEPGAHRASTLKARYALRLHPTFTCANVDGSRWSASVAKLSPRGGDATGISRGNRTPAFRPTVVVKVTFRAVHTAASLKRASVVETTTADTKRQPRPLYQWTLCGHRNSWLRSGNHRQADAEASACRPHAPRCTREFFGTPRSRNSIWSARILRFLRMNASYRFGMYGT
jgi:hypothetical protein